MPRDFFDRIVNDVGIWIGIDPRPFPIAIIHCISITLTENGLPK